MFVILAHNWWMLLLRGILALVFGVMCFIYPGLTLLVLAMLFGAYVLVTASSQSSRRFPPLRDKSAGG